MKEMVANREVLLGKKKKKGAEKYCIICIIAQESGCYMIDADVLYL